MRMKGRYWLVLSFGAAVALATAACDGMIPVAPSAGVATTNMSVASQPAPGANMSFAAKASKVDVCHGEGTGSFQLISVSDNALPAHLAHGDAQPGDPVPGVKGKVFDKECNQVDAVSCPCWAAATLPEAPVTQCFNGLPDSFLAGVSDKAGFTNYHLEIKHSYCYVKSTDAALRVDPTTITAAEAGACLALLQPLCPVR